MPLTSESQLMSARHGVNPLQPGASGGILQLASKIPRSMPSIWPSLLKSAGQGSGSGKLGRP